MNYVMFFNYLLLFAIHQYMVCASVDTSGFISIDCGSTTSTNFHGLNYSTDAGFIESGKNHNISTNSSTPDTPQQLLTLRSFPEGKRNCYNLSLEAAAGVRGRKGNKYLIRITFKYGNYDGKNQYPVFDMYLGVDKWVTISEDNYWEIIHVPTSNYVYVCFVNTGFGIPFISLLELRTLNAKAYNTTNINNDPARDSLEVWGRQYVAQKSTNQTIRYPDDIYDRQWSPWNSDRWKVLRTEFTVPNLGSGKVELPPSMVLQSAAISNIINDSSLYIAFPGGDTFTRYAFCFYFSEVEQGLEQDRQFVLYLNNNSVGSVRLTNFLQIQSLCFDGGNVRNEFNFRLQKTAGSANPVFTAWEYFVVRQFLQSQTHENDVYAVVNLKATYGLKKSNWEGDPCLPHDFLWEGLGCITDDKNASFSPRITHLDLSFSGLSGNVAMYLSNLTSLQFLDLSNNRLVGQIPEFLSQLPSLKVLNLTGNNFTGPIPQKLLYKNNTGLLILRIDKTKKKGLQQKLVPILISLAVTLSCILFIILFTFRRVKKWFTKLRRRMRRTRHVNRANNSEKKKGDGKEVRKFTYSEIKEMTNDFEIQIGKGGFGEVFLGSLSSGLQVAVKRLFREYTGAYNDFITEVNFLKDARHPNLTSLFGYSEDEQMAFVFEYMPNGSLNKFLCEGSEKIFTWLERLKIAYGAAQGLLYLHEECNHIHRDIKPENILLDEIFEAKLADFGLVREISVDATHVLTMTKGTNGYLDPEYYTKKQLRRETDVYSFGVVLLLLIAGQPTAIRKVGTQSEHVLEWVKKTPEKNVLREIVDAKLKGNFDKKSAKRAFKLAKDCASKKSVDRPIMRQVVTELGKCLKLARAHEVRQKLKYNNTAMDSNAILEACQECQKLDDNNASLDRDAYNDITQENVNDLTASVGHDLKCFSFS